jgi:hypothetical protein
MACRRSSDFFGFCGLAGGVAFGNFIGSFHAARA